MSYRYMRVIVLFDLPVQTSEDRRNYRHFRNAITNMGFAIMQKSVYTRIALNKSHVRHLKAHIRKHKPPRGLVQVLLVTEKQFADMEWIVGESTSNVIDTDESVVVI